MMRKHSWRKGGPILILLDVPLFTGRYGLQAKLPDDHNEMDILDLFLTPELYELIIVETNRYATQYFEKKH